MTTDKSAKELAYLHDLYVAPVWTERFAELIDKNIKLPVDGQFLYVEAGTGNHVLELREKLDKKVVLFSSESDRERLSITRAKAKAVSAAVKFQNSAPHELQLPDASFETVICDASFVKTNSLPAVWKELFRVSARAGNVALVLPTAGSFGEFFSVFWEALYALGMEESGAEVEKLVQNLPTVSDIEKMAASAGFKKIEANTNIERFEFETGEEFLNSSLVADFLYPVWAKFVPKASHAKLLRAVEKVINESTDGLKFWLSVKMTLITAQKS